MALKYDHKAIEKKWQKKWADENAFAASDSSDKQKLYILDMFPYPSGAGLHVGHVEGYTATDIYSRFKRMQGYNVLHPMGWDAFGLPAENYAIKTGVPPVKTTDEAIKTFTRQINSLGLSYDWSREIGTHTPEYYKWTQWFFLFLYNKGLAEKRRAKVNWCPKDQTVLANEQVVNGCCERCGTEVVQKDLEQWFFKITKYADALVDDLDQVDWPESTKIAQRNWIGRSEGAEIKFDISNSSESITVFTTRADTIFGATYLVLAPEHPLLQKLKNHIENWESEVLPYMEVVKNKTDIERQEEGKEKTGVELKGIKAINPANQEEIPVFVADYVLGNYGTGAIMAVPAHDRRDREFADVFGLPIRKVVEPGNPRIMETAKLKSGSTEDIFVGENILINSGDFTGLQSAEAKKKITEAVGGKMVKTYRLRDWLISRQRYWGAPIPVVYDPEGKPHAVPEEHLPWLLPTDVEFKPTGTSPLGQSKELLERTEKIFGIGWKPEIDTMDTFVCSSWYYFRFADPRNSKEFASKEAMQKWLPVDLYVGGAEHTVLHLLYSRFITKVLQQEGYITFGEPFKKLRHQGIILAEDGNKMSKSKGNVINPDDVVATYGADTLRVYEMFMGPLEAMKPWNTQNILGARRFLEHVWDLQEKVTDGIAGAMDMVHRKTVEKVSSDLEHLKFNTAISALMIFVGEAKRKEINRAQYEDLLRLLSPLAPHITSEIAERMGYSLDAWPQPNTSDLPVFNTPIAIQVNGKLRATIELPPAATQEEALAAARKDPAVARWLALGKEEKAVYVAGRIISFAVSTDPV
ncbi:MAG TPA: leucine--tRNA ligase [Candidatus Paceibacterota bacterium]|nr:leucine--tRNA ligase [Candidatus Paceibacterota bacterium]